MKPAEEGAGTILRLFEAHRARGPVTLTFGRPVARIWQTDLLEANGRELPHDTHTVRLSLRPFEIVSLRILWAA